MNFVQLQGQVYTFKDFEAAFAVLNSDPTQPHWQLQLYAIKPLTFMT